MSLPSFPVWCGKLVLVNSLLTATTVPLFIYSPVNSEAADTHSSVNI